MYGFALTLFIAMPLFDLLGFENDFDAFIFVAAEPSILMPMALQFLASAGYNATGQTVTKLLSANHRTILEGLRAFAVWGFALLQHVVAGAPWGEPWCGWASLLQLLGFLIQLAGSLIFYSVIRFSWLPDGPPAPPESDPATSVSEAYASSEHARLLPE